MFDVMHHVTARLWEVAGGGEEQLLAESRYPGGNVTGGYTVSIGNGAMTISLLWREVKDLKEAQGPRGVATEVVRGEE